MLGDLNSVKIDGACELGEGNELGEAGWSRWEIMEEVARR